MENILKIGDIVCDSKGSIWGSQRFIVNAFFGGASWRMLSTYKVDGKHTPGSEVNLLQSNARIVDAQNRPFRNTDMRKLLKLITRGVLEAKRELKMRNNTKKIYNVK